MKIVFDTFSGERPRLDPRKLPPTAAARAVNIDTASGCLAPLAAPVAAVDASVDTDKMNLFPNGDFASSDLSELAIPSAWTHQAAGGRDGSAAIVVAEAGWRDATPVLHLEEGETYTFAVWYRSTSGVAAGVQRLGFGGSIAGDIDLDDQTGDWVFAQKQFTVDASMAGLKAVGSKAWPAESVGAVWLDSIILLRGAYVLDPQGGGSAGNNFIVHDGTIYAFGNTSYFAPGPVDQDRLYISTKGQRPLLHLVDTGQVHDLALALPSFTPLVEIEDAAPAPGADDPPLPAENVLFCFTWVTDLGEETPPSPPSEPILVTEGSTVRVTFDATPPTGSRITKMRIYRSATSATGLTSFYFVAELFVAATSYVSDLTLSPLQEPLPSTDYDAPRDEMTGMCSMWNGMMAGHTNRELCFAEPFKPHAWPRKYELLTDYDITGIAATGQMLVIGTKGTPYVATGTAPENILLERLDINLPCVSSEGMVDMGMGLAYPSHDGLVLMQGGAPQIVTRELFSRAEWQKMRPNTFRAQHFNGRYLFSHEINDAGARATAMIDLSGETPGVVSTTVNATNFAYDLIQGALFFGDGTSTPKKWAAHEVAFLPMEYRTATLQVPVNVSIGCILVEGEEIPSETVSIAIYVDGALKDTITTLNHIERLSPGYGREYSIAVTGAARIHRITLASEPEALLQ